VWLYAAGGAVASFLGAACPAKPPVKKGSGTPLQDCAPTGVARRHRGRVRDRVGVRDGEAEPEPVDERRQRQGEHAARVANGHDVRRIDVVGHTWAAVDDHHGRERAR